MSRKDIWLGLPPHGADWQQSYTDSRGGTSELPGQKNLPNYGQTSYVRPQKGQPNIIVVMNESFADLSVLAGFSTNVEVMPFFSSLEENAIKGYIHSSIIGGNTATSEYEFLTSDSMAFLPPGSVAYQQFIAGPMPTLNSMLEDIGYYSVAMHPYYASGWERDEVYPYFGFDKIKFMNDFRYRQKVRNYISDKSLYDEILMELEDAPEDQPSFIFTVSMQNHGGYSKTFENFQPDVLIQQEGNFSWVQNYLSLVRKSDAQLQDFLGQVEELEEDTIVLFFGDHQPNNSTVASLSWMDSYSDDPNARNIVPYLIWANYDIEEQPGQTTSLNYLAGDLLAAAGIEASPYIKFLDDLQQEIPVITADYYITKDGALHYHDDEEQSDPLIRKMLSDYEVLQYNHLIDVRRRVPEIFAAP